MSATAARSGGTARAAQAAATRRRLIVAAVELFSSGSYEDVSVTDIAESAGVAHGLMFHYFGSKRGIYLEAMNEAAEALDAAFVMQAGLPPRDQLHRAFCAHLQYLATHQGLALRLVLGGRGADPQAWEVFEASRARAWDRVAALLGLDVDQGNRALRLTVRAATAAIDEASVFWLRNDKPFSTDEMADYFIELMISGLRAATSMDPTVRTENAVQALLGEPAS